MTRTLLDWLDREPWHYWSIALLTTVAWTVTLLIDRDDRRWPRTWWLWSGASVLLLLAWRWPFLVGPAIANPDEAQMIAGAITLKSYPIFWKYVDGTTHGPLADVPLLFAHAFGVPLSYGGARFVGGMMMIGGWLLAARGLRHCGSFSAIRLGLAPVILLWVSISFYDFSGYTSEMPAIFFALVAIWPLASALRSPELSIRQRASLLALGGALLGCIPYAKIQGIPLGVAIGAVSLIAAWRRPARGRFVTALLAGALAPSLFLAVYLIIWGLTQQFWLTYVLNNLLYADGGEFSWWWMISQLWSWMDVAPGLQPAAGITILAFLAALVVSCRWRPIRRPWLPADAPLLSRIRVRGFSLSPGGASRFLLAAVVVVAGVYCVLAPRRFFAHYLQFLSVPLGALGIVAWCELRFRMAKLSGRAEFAVLAILALLMASPLIVARLQRANPEMRGEWTRRQGEMRYPASIAIAQLAQPGDTMTVWGWMPYFYVETGLPQAARDGNTQRQIQGSMVEFYRQRYLWDLQRRLPRIFVDAVGGNNFGYNDRSPEHRHESFPLLRDFVARHYFLAATVDGSRIYIRKQ